MAFQTALAELLDRLSATRRAMRIVAGSARQSSPTLLKALGLSQSVGGAVDLEFVVMPGSRRVVEMNQVAAQILARTKRINGTAKSPHGLRQLVARRFQMTLLTDIHLTFRTQSGWIDNAQSNRLNAVPAGGDCHMLRPRAMAPLAVDSTR